MHALQFLEYDLVSFNVNIIPSTQFCILYHMKEREIKREEEGQRQRGGRERVRKRERKREGRGR